tara:strand:+ start:9352 stop:10083 length:732 start_codon:yes stop_codon:yes gene_type:complete
MPNIKVTNDTLGAEIYKARGESLSIDSKVTIIRGGGDNSVEGLDVSRAVTLRASTETGISELSGSLLMLRGKDEAMFFHIGGDQYVSNNAYFEADSGPWGAWVFATGSGTHSAFRWGFKSNGRFELSVDNEGTEAETVSWTTAMVITSSTGHVGVGKTLPDFHTLGSFNAQLDVSGSHNAVALAVTGTVDLGGAAIDSTFILPRVNTAQRNALPSLSGSLVYNNQTNKLNFYNGSGWQVVSED